MNLYHMVRWVGHLIKYPQFPDVVNALNVQSHNIILLTVCHQIMLLSLRLPVTAYRWSSSLLLNGISQNKTLYEAEQHGMYKCFQFHFASYVHDLQEFIVLDNSIRLLYFHVCFLVFPPFVYSCCLMDRSHHSHKSCRSTVAQLRHHSSGTLTALFSSACFLLGHVECPCQPSQCRRLSHFYLAMFQLIYHCYKNCLDGYDDLA